MLPHAFNAQLAKECDAGSTALDVNGRVGCPRYLDALRLESIFVCTPAAFEAQPSLDFQRAVEAHPPPPFWEWQALENHRSIGCDLRNDFMLKADSEGLGVVAQ